MIDTDGAVFLRLLHRWGYDDFGHVCGRKKNVGIHLQNFVAIPFQVGKYRDGKMSLISVLIN